MTEPTTNAAAPSDILLSLVVILLAPVFLGVTAGDLTLARMAALHTIDDYRARNHADLVAVAQIVGFGLAALGSLSLSLADDISLSMTLRLRGNAVACNRAAEQNRKARVKHQAEEPRPPAELETIAYRPPSQPDSLLNDEASLFLAAQSQARLEPTECPIPSPTPAATRTPEEKRHQQMWAIAMAKESSEIAASLSTLPPIEQQAAAMGAGLLSSTAHDLTYGAPVHQPKPGTPPPL
jgi:hypothetical protein